MPVLKRYTGTEWQAVGGRSNIPYQTSEPTGPVAGDLWVDSDEPSMGTVPACRVYHNANQSIAAATLTILAFNSERYDTDSMHSTATNTSRITFNTAGLYLVTASILWAAGNGTWTSSTSFWANGTTYLARQQALGVTSGDAAQSVSTVYKFAVGEYVEVRVWQNSGTLNVLSSGNMSPEFSATWIGNG